MSILNITTEFAGQVGVQPRLVRVSCNDSFNTVTAAGFLNSTSLNGYPLYPSDIVAVTYGTNADTSQFFTLSISNDVITLVPMGSNVTLPVTANHIAVYADASGDLTDDAATAINGGNIQAGLSGTAGALSSFPATAAKGSLKIAAAANVGDTITTITNASMGQASTLTIPDPGSVTAKFNLTVGNFVDGNLVSAVGTTGITADAGYRIIAATTAPFGGGGSSNAYEADGLTDTSVVVANVLVSTNNVSIFKVIPSTDTLTVIFSADPGAATTVNYIAINFS